MVRQDLPIPPRPPDFILLAKDDDGIVAVGSFEHDDGFAYLGVVAVALRAQGQGLGREVMGRMLDRIVERAVEQGSSEVLIECRIDPRNLPSIGMVSRFGFKKFLEPDLEYDADGIAHEEGEVVLDLWRVVLLIQVDQSDPT